MAYLFLLHVAGALALLLWAIHMVQTGIDRGCGRRSPRPCAGPQGPSVLPALDSCSQ